MILGRGYKFRLYATPEQEVLFGQYAGVCRLVYNLALEQRRDWWRLYQANTGSSLSYAAQCRELTVLRAEVEWIAAVSVICQQQALRDLDRAFSNFFSGIAGYPAPRKRGENDAFRFNGRDCSWRTLNARWGAVTLPKIGAVKFRLTRDIPGVIKNVTITRDALGWHVVFTTEVEAAVTANFRPAVGLDRGIVHTLALSDGTFRDIDRARLNVLDRRARKQARALAPCPGQEDARLQAPGRCPQGAGPDQGRAPAASLEPRTLPRDGRHLWLGRAGRAEHQRHAILETGWHQFETILSYKVAAAGGEVRKVNPSYTSQTCSHCGTVDKTSRESQATFRCPHCGHVGHADINAAVNIFRAGTQPAPRTAVGRPKKRELKREA